MKDGERYLLSKDVVKIAPPPPLNETPERVGARMELKFADQDQANRWIAEQERDGFRVKVEPAGPVKTQIIAQPLHATRTLGDETFMRAILYLSLTFLAHGYPDLARSPSLVIARNIVEKDEPVGDRVLWELPGTMEQLSTNPFPYGHTVAIGAISNTNKIGALISFYGVIHFGVDLGEFAGLNCPKCITTHIDPLAERPPNDIHVSREEGRYLVLSTPEESRRFLDQLKKGQAINPLMSILQSASDEELSRTCQALMLELTALRAITPSLRPDRIMQILAVHDQRIFNLMRESIQRFSESASDLPAPIHIMLKVFIAANDGAARGLEYTSEAALLIAKASLADAILARINDDSLDAQVLAELLGGNAGVGVVLRILTNIIVNALPQEKFLTACNPDNPDV